MGARNQIVLTVLIAFTLVATFSYRSFQKAHRAVAISVALVKPVPAASEAKPLPPEVAQLVSKLPLTVALPTYHFRGRSVDFPRYRETVWVAAQKNDFPSTVAELITIQNAYNVVFDERQKYEAEIAHVTYPTDPSVTEMHGEPAQRSIEIPAYPEYGAKLYAVLNEVVVNTLGKSRAIDFQNAVGAIIDEENHFWGRNPTILAISAIPDKGYELKVVQSKWSWRSDFVHYSAMNQYDLLQPLFPAAR